jgi:hypothetical protein
LTRIKRSGSTPLRRRYRASVLRTIPVRRQYSICVRPLVRYWSNSCSISSVLRRRAMPLVSAASRSPSRGLRQTLTADRPHRPLRRCAPRIVRRAVRRAVRRTIPDVGLRHPGLTSCIPGSTLRRTLQRQRTEDAPALQCSDT